MPTPITPADLEAALTGAASPASATVEEIRALFAAANALLRAGDYAAVDGVLEHMQPEDLPSDMAVSLLRFTANAKDRLPHWSTALARTRTVIESRSQDVEGMLLGLSS